MVRVAEGVGYWLQPGMPARQLGIGDGLLTSSNSNGVLRASQLGELKLQFFVIQPQYLNGLLTVAEWHQLGSGAEQSVGPGVDFCRRRAAGPKVHATGGTAEPGRFAGALRIAPALGQCHRQSFAGPGI